MRFAKLRHLLAIGLCALVLLGLKAYRQPTGSTTAASNSPTAEAPDQGRPTSDAATFDYYLLSLSWSPEYCASEARPNDSQCQRPYAFVAHGLWPQNERGYPDNCGPGAYLDGALIDQMLPIMPSKSLIIHEWNKHGVCSGLGAERYFSTLTTAFHSIKVPARYQALGDYMRTTTAAIEGEFITANPTLKPEMLALQCRGQYLQEVRICMNRDLVPRACGSDIRDRCGEQVVLRPGR